MKAKTFDCVAMKRTGAAKVYQLTKGMTIQQELAFWRQQTAAMLDEQRAAKARLARKKQRA